MSISISEKRLGSNFSASQAHNSWDLGYTPICAYY